MGSHTVYHTQCNLKLHNCSISKYTTYFTFIVTAQISGCSSFTSYACQWIIYSYCTLLLSLAERWHFFKLAVAHKYRALKRIQNSSLFWHLVGGIMFPISPRCLNKQSLADFNWCLKTFPHTEILKLALKKKQWSSIVVFIDRDFKCVSVSRTG